MTPPAQHCEHECVCYHYFDTCEFTRSKHGSFICDGIISDGSNNGHVCADDTRSRPTPAAPEPSNIPSGVRPQVVKFAIAMELVLRKNDYKGGWDDLGFYKILERIYDEVEEARREMRESKSGAMRRASREIVDAANFCMMFFDNLYGRGDPNTEYLDRKLSVISHQPPSSPDNALLDEIISFCESKRSISPLPFHEGERCIIDWILSTAEMRGYKHRQSQPGGDSR